MTQDMQANLLIDLRRAPCRLIRLAVSQLCRSTVRNRGAFFSPATAANQSIGGSVQAVWGPTGASSPLFSTPLAAVKGFRCPAADRYLHFLHGNAPGPPCTMRFAAMARTSVTFIALIAL